ncbi:MAG: DUF4249 domain-containing protein [Saprospiraceae bacterium]|nr:DUF4249 domain-containing protein [Saprospiraceae bacterium]
MIHPKRLQPVLALLLLSSLWGCLSQIDLPAPPSDAENIAITATLRKDAPSVLDVRVVEVDNFSGFSAPVPIDNAIIFLKDDLGNEAFVPLRFSGQYQRILGDAETDMVIEAGRSYQLVVNLGVGRVYTSEFETLNTVPEASALDYALETREAINELGNIVDQNFVRFFIDTPLKSNGTTDKAVLKWDMEGVYKIVESVPANVQVPNQRTCYVFEDLQLEKPVVFNGNESGKDILEGQFIIEERADSRFAQGFYLVVRQQSITEGAYDYWESIRKVVDRSGNFFDEPPGKIRGNFSNLDNPSEDVFGYFSALQEDTIRLYVPPSALGIAIFPECPSTIPEGQEPPRAFCFDCLLLRNSTTQRPDFWIE